MITLSNSWKIAEFMALRVLGLVPLIISNMYFSNCFFEYFDKKDAKNRVTNNKLRKAEKKVEELCQNNGLGNMGPEFRENACKILNVTKETLDKELQISSNRGKVRLVLERIKLQEKTGNKTAGLSQYSLEVEKTCADEICKKIRGSHRESIERTNIEAATELKEAALYMEEHPEGHKLLRGKTFSRCQEGTIMIVNTVVLGYVVHRCLSSIGR